MNIREISSLPAFSRGNHYQCILPNEEEEITDLLTDSRNHFKPEGTLFFAIATKGGNDGHRFIRDLYEKGVRNFVAEHLPEDKTAYPGANFLIVADTTEALTEIGRLHRSNAKERVAITGSRGKTTLKEMIFQLMEPYRKISRSPRSFNSKIGVPLSLWQISPGSDIALIEAGISKKDEMGRLCNMIAPDTVIFTNIGDAHSNGFESLKEKAEEKAKLASHPNVKCIIYPMDCEVLDEALKPYTQGKTIIRWSQKNPEAELFVINRGNAVEYKWQGTTHSIPFKTEKAFDTDNIAAALAFMLKEGLPAEEIEKRARSLRRINTRLNVSEGVNGCSIIMDSYTSDVSSLLPAIDFMKRRRMPHQSLTLVTSDLRHEVQSTESAYARIAGLAKETGIKKFIGIGPMLKEHASMFPAEAIFYNDTESFLKDFSASDFNDEIILLKGSPDFDFEKIHERLEVKKHETVLEVNLDAILRNYNYFRSLIPPSAGVVAMVKASGYGAGSYEIAKTLQDAGAAYLAVAALDEGIDIRKNGISMPVMVMNPHAANYRALFKNRLEPVIYSMSMLNTLTSEAGKYSNGEYPVHIKLDTGMHRMGFEENDLDELLRLLGTVENIKVASIFSHLATADCLDMDKYTYRQLERFEEMSGKIMSALGYPVKRHILNSAGIIRFPQFHYDLVRLGIGLYGANTLPPDLEKPLSTVSTLRSVIICIREIEGTEAVGYGRKGKITGKTRVATIPIGYADGMNRKFGNGAIKVLVNGRPAPTIGNICMDATMIDVTGIDCKEGDSVEIFGENMSVQTLADTLDTIPYEILTSVSPRVKRVYYRE